MIIPKDKKKEKRIEIDLTGSQGNAYALLGLARQLAKQLGKSEKEIMGIMMRMKSGDYDNLLKVFEEEFGEYVIMYK